MGDVFWAQGAISFLIWIAFGVFLSRRSQVIRRRVSSLSRGKRVAFGAMLLCGSLLALMLCLLGIMQAGGFGERSMTLWAWPIVTVLGVGFVFAQTFATAMLVTLAQESVTDATSKASTAQDRTSYEKTPD